MSFQELKAKLSNFWYYQKWLVAAILVAVVTFTFFTVQCATRTQPDYSVVLYLNQTVSLEQRIGLQTLLEKTASDLNGDGRVAVEVFDVSFSNDEINTAVVRANRVKAIGQMSLSDSMIYITDQVRFPEYQEHGLFQKIDWMPAQEGYAWNWQGSEMQTLLSELGMPENLYFSLRRIEGTSIADHAGATERLEQSRAWLQKIMEVSALEKTE